MEISTTGSIDPELEQTLGKFGNAINVRNQSVAAINQSIDYIDRLEDFAHPLRIFILENDFENNLNQEQFMTLKVLIDAAIPFLRSLDNSAAHVSNTWKN